MSDKLAMWTIYDHPSDYPNNFVARKFVIGDGSEPVITKEMMVCPSLTAIREMLAELGLSCITRSEDDDPKIVETWL